MSLFECLQTTTFQVTMHLQFEIRDFMALENLDVIV